LPALTDIEQARELVLERAPSMPAEEVPIAAARGRVLAEPVEAGDEQVPGFDNSAMDGYAVRATDAAGASEDSPVRLRVVGESRAGHPAEGAVAEGEAIAISTGAMVPVGADAVVRVEDTSAANGAVEIRVAPAGGLNIRRAGEDVRAGERLIEAGTELGPAELGVAVSVGLTSLAGARRPRVSVLATGDELVGPGEPLFPGAVRNSNMHTVPALALDAGAEVVAARRVKDTADATREAIATALEAADVVIVSGGVSVGEHDHVRPVFAELGVEQVFWGVSLRPGKPTYFGVGEDGTLVFGLPGNPVSAMVTFLLFARPALRRMLGASDDRPRATAILAEPYAKKPGRAHAVRVTLELAAEGWRATPTGDQGSHVLTSMLGADALAYVPAERGDVAAGETVEIELLPGRLGGVT
jgi:molybdopterin molybdotransferase